MTTKEILAELKKLGTPAIKKIHENHGAKGVFYGVRIGDMKPLQKKLKKNYETSLELFDSGITDAMYLAGLIADETKMTEKDLDKWVKNSYWHMISEYTVAWIAAESAHGHKLALKWIKSKDDSISSAGWNTLSSLLVLEGKEILIAEIKELLEYIKTNIHKAGNRTRYTMNGFIITTGINVPELRELCKKIAKEIGKIHVDVGGTACKVPEVIPYIEKALTSGREIKKKKHVRC